MWGLTLAYLGVAALAGPLLVGLPQQLHAHWLALLAQFDLALGADSILLVLVMLALLYALGGTGVQQQPRLALLALQAGAALGTTLDLAVQACALQEYSGRGAALLGTFVRALGAALAQGQPY